MTPLHKAAQMALDALDAITDDVDGTGLNTMPSFDKALDAIATLREALEAPEPEPVAWRYGVPKLNGVEWRYTLHKTRDDATPLYAAPPAAPDHLRDVAEKVAPPVAPAPAAPAAPVVPLTDEQLAKIAVEDEFLLYCDQDSFNEIARAIEAAHGITGGKP